jgi:uncharacterized iron-regulated membrane protein
LGRRTARRALGTFVYRSHVWFGVVTAMGVIAISVTGIYLNHVNDLGFWRPPEPQSQGSIDNALPIRQLIIHGLTAGHNAGLDVVTPRDVARVTYSPASNQAAVRFTDRRSTEAVLDATTGEVLQVASRDDIKLEQLHTGEILGQRGVIVSDVLAGALVLLTIGGVWLWLNRLVRRTRAGGLPAGRGWWMQANRWLHLFGGLGVGAFVILLSVTGVLLNHKRELGFMEEPFQSVEYEPHERGEPMPLSRIAALGIKNAGAPELDAVSDIRFIDFRLPAGYAKVRFTDEKSTEVIVNVYNGRIVNVSERQDFFLEELHGGDELGGLWGRRLIDASGLMLILLTLNGLYLWIWPVWSARSRAAQDEGQVDIAEVEE